MSVHQRTISREVSLSGRGLFSGDESTLTFAPAPPGAGINFVRKQAEKVVTIPALVTNVLRMPRRTCLRNGSLYVETVEHCLAALAGLGIDNALVKLDAAGSGELPGGDGSSTPFVEAIQDAGIAEQEAAKEPLIIRKPIQVS